MRDVKRVGISDGTLMRLEDEVARLARRAEKLGLEAPAVTVTASRREPRVNPETLLTEYPTVHDVTIALPDLPICKPGYRLVALAVPPVEGMTVDDSAARIVTVVERGSSFDPAILRAEKLGCDHCRATRRRAIMAAVLEESTGRFLVLGSDCLTQYVPCSQNAVEFLAALLEFERTRACELDDDEGFGAVDREHRRAWDLDSVLTAAADHLRTHPFRRAAEDDGGTKGELYELLAGKASSCVDARAALRKRLDDPSHAATMKAEVDATKAWVDGLAGASDFEQNVKAGFAPGFVGRRNLGIVCAAVHLAKKATEERRAREARAKGKHVGEIGQRLELGRCVLVGSTPIPGRYGDKYCCRFVLEDGSRVTWFASDGATPHPQLPDGRQVGLIALAEEKIPLHISAATVKEHEEFRGEPVTVVSRVVVHLAGEEPKKVEKKARKKKLNNDAPASSNQA